MVDCVPRVDAKSNTKRRDRKNTILIHDNCRMDILLHVRQRIRLNSVPKITLDGCGCGRTYASTIVLSVYQIIAFS